jgi:hypothetical protein
MAQLFTTHHVASSPADAIAQWFNAGGMIDFYDFPIDVLVNVSSIPLDRMQLTYIVCRARWTWWPMGRSNYLHFRIMSEKFSASSTISVRIRNSPMNIIV